MVGGRAPSLVSLLEREAPGTLQALRAEYPGAADALASDRVLGEAKAALAAGPERRAALVALVEATRDTLVRKIEELLSLLSRQRRKITSVRLGGALVAAVGGVGGAAATLLGAGAQVTALVTAACAAAGGTTTILADSLERTPSGQPAATAEEHGRILEMRGELERLRLRLQRDALLPLPDDQFDPMLARLDGIAEMLEKWRSRP